MAGDNSESGDPTGAAANGATAAAAFPEWECAVARASACLRATAKRYRVNAPNPARAALAALRRHGLDAPTAREAGVWIAVHLLPDTSTPRAIFAVAGTPEAPTLQLRAADLLPPASPLLGAEGPFDADAIEREIPRAARRSAQATVGSSGLREVLHGAFWQREATLYSSTAMILAAFGFPMNTEVFAIGGVLLLIQGTVRLMLREGRIAVIARRLLADTENRAPLRAQAVRALFARVHELAGKGIAPQRRVLRTAAAVPDLNGEARLLLLIDENAAVTTGRPGGPPGFVVTEDAGNEPTLTASDNVLTMVFRRPRRPAEAEQSESVPPSRRSQDRGGLPAVVGPAPQQEEIEIIDAELLDPDAYYADDHRQDWWA